MKRFFTLLILISLMTLTFGIEIKAIEVITDYDYIITNPDIYGTSANDQFGNGASISNGYYAIGCKLEDYDVSYADSGYVAIYSVSTGERIKTILNPNHYGTPANDQFGEIIQLYEEYLIVGTYLEASAGGISSGVVYVFNWITDTLLYTLENYNYYGTSASDFFGHRVATDGTYLVVGAMWEETDSTNTNSGIVYVYNLSTGVYLYPIFNPNIYGTKKDDNFGNPVSIYGDYIVVSALGEDSATGTSSGVVYVFNSIDGTLIKSIVNPNEYGTPVGDQFGFSIAIDDKYLIVGTLFEKNFAGDSNVGIVYVFDILDDFSLLTFFDNPNINGTSVSDMFGRSVKIFNEYIVVQAQGEEGVDTFKNGGAIYIYDSYTFELLFSIHNPNYYGTGATDYFGIGMDFSDYKLIAGAYSEDDVDDSAKGIAYLFDIPAQIETFIVTFDSNGGSAVSPIAEQEVGTLIVKPADPTKTDNSFIGWYENANLTDKWRFTYDTMPYHDLILYARWSPDVDVWLDDVLDGFGLNTVFAKIVISIILTVIVLIVVAIFLKPPIIITLLIMVSLLIMFIALGWIPLWIIILLTIILFAIFYLTMRGGGSGNND